MEIQRLLRTAKPEADESFMGYILRLTELNGYKSPSWLMSSVGLNHSLSRHSCSFISESSEPLKLLAGLSGITAPELAQLTYQLVNDYQHCSFFGVSIDRHCIRPGWPKICPECLRENAYCHRAWECALITVCHIHECMLLDECPNCGRPIMWSRGSVSRCSCKFDWREAPVKSVKEQELKVTRIIHYLCGLPCDEAISSTLAQHNLVPKLSLQAFISAIVFMAGQLQGLSVITCTGLLPVSRRKELHTFITQASYIFEDWPNSFYQFLREWSTQERNTSLAGQRLKSPLYRDFGKLYLGLYTILEDEQFDFIRDAFIDYLTEEWKGGGLSPSKKKAREPHVTGRYVSKGDTRRILKIDDLNVDKLIEAGELKTVVQSKGMKRLIFVDVQDIAKLKRS